MVHQALGKTVDGAVSFFDTPRKDPSRVVSRQIGKMLNAREPKIVNGPQILDKYVGESEANVRKLFAEAEEEEKRVMRHSPSFHSESSLFSVHSPCSWDRTAVCTSLSSMKSMPFVNLVVLWFVDRLKKSTTDQRSFSLVH